MHLLTRITVMLTVGLGLMGCSKTQDQGTAAELLERANMEKVNIETVKLFNEYLDKQDSASLEKIIDQDFACYFGSSELPLRYKELKPLIKEVYTAFPDYKHEIEILFASGGFVASKLHYTGTHSRPYAGNKATGKVITYKGIFIFKLREGRIVELHGFEDDLASLTR